MSNVKIDSFVGGWTFLLAADQLATPTGSFISTLFYGNGGTKFQKKLPKNAVKLFICAHDGTPSALMGVNELVATDHAAKSQNV